MTHPPLWPFCQSKRRVRGCPDRGSARSRALWVHGRPAADYNSGCRLPACRSQRRPPMTAIPFRPLPALLACLALALPAAAADWPHWLGPNGNGSSPETGLLTRLPDKGPKILWKVPGGAGYSAIAVAGGRAITLVQRDGDELALALDPATGKELWKQRIGPAFKNDFGNGPRSTPAIEGGLVWAQSVTGPLVCLKADSGEIVWQHHLLKEFGAKNITWGLSASPLIDGDKVLAIPGGKGAGVAA